MNGSSRILAMLLAAIGIVGAGVCVAAGTSDYKPGPIWLISPEPVVTSRAGRNVEPMVEYITRIHVEAGKYLAAPPNRPPLSGVITFALRPGRLSRVWIECGEPGLSPDDTSALRLLLEKIPAIDVKDGPVAVAFSFSFRGGGKAPAPMQGLPMPIPKEWADALNARGGGNLPDDALAIVWPAP